MTSILDSRATPLQRELALGGQAIKLSDADLLAVLFGTGCEGQSARATASALLEFAGGLAALKFLGPHLLAMQRGIGPAKAARLVVAIELGRRFWMPQPSPLAATFIRSFGDVTDWAQRLTQLDHEELWSLALNGQNRLLHARCVSRGGQHGCAVRARDILRGAIRDGASGLVVVHNHPSGDPSPSTEDIAMTAALVSACDAVGLPLLDHVIVAEQGASSLYELGAFSAARRESTNPWPAHNMAVSGPGPRSSNRRRGS